jgi:hypothetical protein
MTVLYVFSYVGSSKNKVDTRAEEKSNMIKRRRKKGRGEGNGRWIRSKYFICTYKLSQ